MGSYIPKGDVDGIVHDPDFSKPSQFIPANDDCRSIKMLLTRCGKSWWASGSHEEPIKLGLQNTLADCAVSIIITKPDGSLAEWTPKQQNCKKQVVYKDGKFCVEELTSTNSFDNLEEVKTLPKWLVGAQEYTTPCGKSGMRLVKYDSDRLFCQIKVKPCDCEDQENCTSCG